MQPKNFFISVILISTLAALLLASNIDFSYLLRLQPMRSFHLIYVVFFLLLGGVLGEYLLRSHVWRWILCFGALAGAEVLPFAREAFEKVIAAGGKGIASSSGVLRPTTCSSRERLT